MWARRSLNSIKEVVYQEDHLIEPIAYFYTEKAYPVEFEVIPTKEPSIFPNPFSNQLTVQIPVDGIQDVKITIMDAMGRPVHVYRADKIAGQLNWIWNPEQKLPSGIYYYQIDLGTRSLKGKLLRVN